MIDWVPESYLDAAEELIDQVNPFQAPVNAMQMKTGRCLWRGGVGGQGGTKASLRAGKGWATRRKKQQSGATS